MSIAEKLTTIAENEQKVYNAGFEDGKTAEWNEMWDGLQIYGGKTDYTNFCASSIFKLKDNNNKYYWNFKPKYDLTIKNGTGMFKSFNASSSGGINHAEIAVDLTQWLEDLGIAWITESLTNANAMFYNCQGLTRAPFMNLSKCTANSSLYNFCGQSAVLTTIDGIESSEDTAWVSSSFSGNNPLSHCIFSGVIGKNLNLSNTRLDHESLISVLNCLKDISGTGTTLTLTLGSTLLAKLTDTEKAIATQKGWTLN